MKTDPLARMEWVKLATAFCWANSRRRNSCLTQVQRVAPLENQQPTWQNGMFFSITSKM